MQNKELTKAEEAYNAAVSQWMHTDSGDEAAEAIAAAAANSASDNLLKVRAKLKAEENKNE